MTEFIIKFQKPCVETTSLACPVIKHVTVVLSKPVTQLLDIVQKVALTELMVLIVVKVVAQAVVATHV